MDLEVPETKYNIKQEFDDDVMIIAGEPGANKKLLQTCPNCTIRIHTDSFVKHVNRCYGETIALKDKQLEVERYQHELAMLKHSIKNN